MTQGDVSADSVGLHVFSKPEIFGVHCPQWIDRQALVVLSSDRLSYSKDEAAAMTAFASGRSNSFTGQNPAPMPSTLRQVAGMPTSATAPLPPGVPGYMFGLTCALELELTNTGPVTLQIPKAGVRFTGTPEPNGRQYRVIEMCSVAHSQYYCGPQLGGGAGPCLYLGNVQLADAPAGTLIDRPLQPTMLLGSPPPGFNCPGLTLDPGATADLRIDLWSAQSFLYRVEPVLTVTTPQGDKHVAIPTQAGIAAFGDPGHFTCNKLHGNDFVPFEQGPSIFDFDKQGSAGNWCL
ncbi:MAG TPA: hypothetical protein VG104_06385 [Candidatus Dormibacteraeota bacterium]|nr:hypothetical protein [Candidatus Dormibacteraeota bacterium]